MEKSKKIPSVKVLAMMLILIVVLVSATTASTKIEVKRCSQFVTRPVAQRAFKESPKKYAWADRDHDGRACEHLPNVIKQVK